MAKATWPVRRERRLRAAAFGTYPTASAAAVTRASDFGWVLMPFSARDADATETFAKRATVVMVGVSGLCFKTSAAKVYGERLQQPEDCIRSVPRSRAKRQGAGDDGRGP